MMLLSSKMEGGRCRFARGLLHGPRGGGIKTEVPPHSPGSTAQTYLPLPNKTHHVIESIVTLAFPQPHLLVPCLNGKPATKAHMMMLLVSIKPSLPALVPKNTVVVRALYKADNAGWTRWTGHAAPQRLRHWASDAQGRWPRCRPQTRLIC